MAQFLARLTVCAALLCAAFAVEAQTIPNLPAASSGNSTDKLPCSQSGTTKYCTPAQILAGGGAIIAAPSASQQITFSYPGVNNSVDALRLSVGGFSITDENSVPSPATAGIVAGVKIPAGSYTGVATWPDSAFAGYILNNNTQKSGVAFTAVAGTSVSGNGGLYGVNAVTVNCELYLSACAPGAGFDFTTSYALEADSVVYSKAGSAQPSGNASGIVSITNNDVQPTGAYAAFTVSYTPSAGSNWKTGYATNTGAAQVGLSLAPKATGNSQDAQGINFTSTSSGGSPYLAQIFEDSVGCMNFLATAGAGSTFQNCPTYPQLQISNNATNSGLKIATSATSSNAVFILQTGTANSNSQFIVQDGNSFQISSGSGLPGGITLSPAAGVVTINAALRLKTTTVSGLSTLDASPAAGDLAVVTDATACTANITVTGGGSSSCAVIYSGTAWKAVVTR